MFNFVAVVVKDEQANERYDDNFSDGGDGTLWWCGPDDDDDDDGGTIWWPASSRKALDQNNQICKMEYLGVN